MVAWLAHLGLNATDNHSITASKKTSNTINRRILIAQSNQKVTTCQSETKSLSLEVGDHI